MEREGDFRRMGAETGPAVLKTMFERIPYHSTDDKAIF